VPTDAASTTTGEGSEDWGPLAIVPEPQGFGDALTSGTLQITDECVLLEAGDELELLVWPADRTTWLAADRVISFENTDGSKNQLRDGDAVSFGGGGDSTREGGTSAADWVEGIDWVSRPAASCPKDVTFWVGEFAGASPRPRWLSEDQSVAQVTLTIHTPTEATLTADGVCQWSSVLPAGSRLDGPRVTRVHTTRRIEAFGEQLAVQIYAGPDLPILIDRETLEGDPLPAYVPGQGVLPTEAAESNDSSGGILRYGELTYSNGASNTVPQPLGGDPAAERISASVQWSCEPPDPAWSPELTAEKPRASLALASGCPLTRPDRPFLAPAPQPERPPARYQSVWFGSSDLWTMLRPEGEVWSALPRTSHSLGQKTFWWSANWPGVKEPEPDIGVTGRRLDGPGTFRAGNPGTNAFADFGSAMLVGVDFPTGGCWELTGRYKGAELSYVVWVEGG
ncbi:MAG TPA: hypothetical protein VGP30_00385, partial [Candidatus Limnocylindrales bacterium]|nr:hypothetical protein [Candidatus Limnocylindrales bacterium]